MRFLKVEQVVGDRHMQSNIHLCPSFSKVFFGDGSIFTTPQSKTQNFDVVKMRWIINSRSGRGRLCHIGHGFFKLSLILYNSDRKVRNKVV